MYLNDRSINKELVEIKSPALVQKLRQEYKVKYSQEATTLKRMTTPLICGTIVKNKNIENMTMQQLD